MQKDPKAQIVSTKHWDDYFLITIKSPSIASSVSPGQFIMVRVTSLDYPLLRRPLSIHAQNLETIDIFFQVSGLGTALLSQKTTGESLDILGPFGQGFSLDGELTDKKRGFDWWGKRDRSTFFSSTGAPPARSQSCGVLWR